jgi:peroxiredoxin
MKQLQVGDKAPVFELPDHKGVMHRLSELTREKNALLVFNIGFA